MTITKLKRTTFAILCARSDISFLYGQILTNTQTYIRIHIQQKTHKYIYRSNFPINGKRMEKKRIGFLFGIVAWVLLPLLLLPLFSNSLFTLSVCLDVCVYALMCVFVCVHHWLEISMYYVYECVCVCCECVVNVYACIFWSYALLLCNHRVSFESSVHFIHDFSILCECCCCSEFSECFTRST